MPVIIGEILKKFWPYIAGGIAMLGLLIALAVTRHTLASRTEQLKVSRQQTANEIAKEQIDLASIARLQSAINDQNNAIGKMVDESNARLKAGTDALAVAKQGRAATQSAIQALQASAGRAGKVGPCVASEAFIAHSDEL